MYTINNIKFISSLEKLYDTDKIPEGDYKGFSMLRNEKKSFQLVFEADVEGATAFTVGGAFDKVKIYTVEHIKSDLPMSKGADDYYRFSESGYYPDLLLPVEGNEVKIKKGVNVLWIEVNGADGKIGKDSFSFTLQDKTAELEIEIIDAKLDFSDFVYTCWFHSDCLMSYYGFEAFSDEYWRVTENFLRTAAEYGQNCVLTPLFTPPLDTEIGGERPTVQLLDIRLDGGKYSFNFDKLTQWIEMAHRCGVEYFELSHFFTQWGARKAPKIMATVDGKYVQLFGWKTRSTSKEYREFLRALSVELKKYIEERNMKDKVFIHISDEPSFTVIPTYGRVSTYIRNLYKGYKVMDALSDYWFYRLKLVPNPVPANDHIDKFIGNVDNLWVYYCSAQNKHNVANRFFCNESLRTRIIGYQMFKFDIKGFLQWGYNFYYKRLSKGLIDPFTVSDAGGHFPSGDSYVVYPAKDGTAYHSIRLKVFYDGLQDMAALKTLSALADKKTCLDIIEKKGSLSFRDYPHDNEWLLETREEVNSAIRKAIG